MSNSKEKPPVPLHKRTDVEVMALYGEWCQAVDKKISERKAADTIAIRERVDSEDFRRKMRRIRKAGGKMHGNRVFTFEEEETIVGVLQAWSLRHRSLSQPELMRIAKALKPDREDWDAKTWSADFLARHKKRLTKVHLKGLAFERVDSVTVDNVKTFVEWYGPWRDENGFKADGILNADETRVTVDLAQLTVKLIECTDKPKYSALMAVAGKGSTYVPFHSASGNIIMSLFVVPHDGHDIAEFPINEVVHMRRDQHPVYFAFTESGWMNAVTWKAALEKLHQEMDLQHPGLRVCLLLDQLKVHLEDDCLRYCQSVDLSVALFPPHCTHFLQPSDDVLFTNFKKQLRYMAATSLHLLRPDARDLGMRLLADAQKILGTLSKSIILRSWRNTAMHPFVPAKILERALLNVGDRPAGQAESDRDSQVSANARNVSQGVIDRGTSSSDPKRVRVRVKKGLLLNADQIREMRDELEAEEAEKEAEKLRKKEEAEAEKAAKAAAKIDRLAKWGCKGSLHGAGKQPVWDEKAQWVWCERCDLFGLCTRCKGKDRALMAAHEAACA
jgi:hypothetical protein